MYIFSVFVEPFIDHSFLRRGLLGCVSLSLGMAPVGLFLVLRRMSLSVDALSHSIFPGIALAYGLFGLSALFMGIGGFITGVLVVICVTLAVKFSVLKEDSSLANFHLISLAIGIVIVSFFGNSFDLLNFLIGNVLALDNNTLTIIVLGSSISLIMLATMFRFLVADTFDRNFLESMGVSEVIVRAVFLCVVVLNLVSGFLAIGPLMVGGLMIIPASTSRILFRSLQMMIFGAIGLSVISGYVGLLISYHFDVPSAAMIILVAGALYVFALIFGMGHSYFSKQKRHLVS